MKRINSLVQKLAFVTLITALSAVTLSAEIGYNPRYIYAIQGNASPHGTAPFVFKIDVSNGNIVQSWANSAVNRSNCSGAGIAVVGNLLYYTLSCVPGTGTTNVVYRSNLSGSDLGPASTVALTVTPATWLGSLTYDGANLWILGDSQKVYQYTPSGVGLTPLTLSNCTPCRSIEYFVDSTGKGRLISNEGTFDPKASTYDKYDTNGVLLKSSFIDGSVPYYHDASSIAWNGVNFYTVDYVSVSTTKTFVLRWWGGSGGTTPTGTMPINGWTYSDSPVVADLSADYLDQPSPVPAFSVPAVICQGSGAVTTPFIQADGSASLNETDYFWSVEESDSGWGRNPLTERSNWFHGAAGKIDLGAFYASLGGQWKCNTYYRVKLAVKNAWVSWNEEVNLIYLSCPIAEADHRPDRQVCCTGAPITLGPQNPDLSDTYSWSAGKPGGPATFFSSVPNPIVQPTTDTKYTLLVGDAHGCQASSSVILSCANNGLSVNISTGVKNGVQDPFGAVDSNWSLLSNPSGPVNQQVYSVKPNTEAFTWAKPNKGENWISPAVNTDGTAPDIAPTDNSNLSKPAYVYHFRNVYLDDTFTNFSLHLNEYAADNSMSMTINGIQPWTTCAYLWGFSVGSFETISGYDVQAYYHGPCDWVAPFGQKGLMPGWNNIDVEVRNGGGAGNKSPSGMVISGQIHGSCSLGGLVTLSKPLLSEH